MTIRTDRHDRTISYKGFQSIGRSSTTSITTQGYKNLSPNEENSCRPFFIYFIYIICEVLAYYVKLTYNFFCRHLMTQVCKYHPCGSKRFARFARGKCLLIKSCGLKPVKPTGTLFHQQLLETGLRPVSWT